MPELRLGLNDKVLFQSVGRKRFFLKIILQILSLKVVVEKPSNWRTLNFINVSVCRVLKVNALLVLFLQMGNLN